MGPTILLDVRCISTAQQIVYRNAEIVNRYGLLKKFPARGGARTLRPMTHEDFMKQALVQAQRAFTEDEVPVGAVVVLQNKIIARGYNQTEKLCDPTAHAEMIALTSAFSALGSKYLPEALLYVTVEPCVMCAGALYWSKIGSVIFGAADPKNGYTRVAPAVSPFHPKTNLVGGILGEDCAELMRTFFAQKRK